MYKIFWCLVLQYNIVYAPIDHLLESSRAVFFKKLNFLSFHAMNSFQNGAVAHRFRGWYRIKKKLLTRKKKERNFSGEENGL